MKKGQLITTPTDTRIYKPKGFKGSITGPAAKLYTKEDIKNMTNKEFEEKEKEIMGNNKWEPCSYQRLIINHLRQEHFVLKSFSTV